MRTVFSILILAISYAVVTFAQPTQTRTLGKISRVDQAPEIQLDFPDIAVGIGPHSVRPLLPGSTVPKFEVTGSTGNIVRFNPQHLEKPIVITFFRGGWCPYCVTQFSNLQNIESTLVELGYDIWFISPAQPDSLSFGDQGRDGAYQLFSDSDLSAAKTFGIAYQVKQSVLDRYFDGGQFLASYSGQDHGQLPVPSSFIISMQGKIVFQYTNPDHTQRIQPDLLLAAARLNMEEPWQVIKRREKTAVFRQNDPPAVYDIMTLMEGWRVYRDKRPGRGLEGIAQYSVSLINELCI